jgi:thioredoxin-dependent peroxiredoxin
MMAVRETILAAAAAVVLTLAFAGPAPALEVGQKAPDFTLPAPGGKTVKLSDLLGKGPVVIYTFIQAYTKP